MSSLGITQPLPYGKDLALSVSLTVVAIPLIDACADLFNCSVGFESPHCTWGATERYFIGFNAAEVRIGIENRVAISFRCHRPTP